MQAENLLSALTKQCQKQKLSRCLSLAYIRARILTGFYSFCCHKCHNYHITPPLFLINQDVPQQVNDTSFEEKQHVTFSKQYVVLCEMSAYSPDA